MSINPIEDSIAIESAENNPYVNIIAVRSGDEDKEEIKALVRSITFTRNSRLYS